MQRYIIASRINVAFGAGQAARREKAFGLVVSCLAGDVLNWYNTRVKGKNWRCNNLSDNLGVANLTAVRTLAARNGGNQIDGLNTAGEFQDEDWSIAGGEPVDNAPVASNAGGGLPAVTIAPSIKLGQLLYLFRTAYTTVEHLKQTAVFSQLMQGDMSDNITKALAEAEKYTLSQMNAPSSILVFPVANPYVDTNRSDASQNTDLQAIAKSFQETMSRATKTLDNSKKSANKRGEDLIIRRFLSELLRGNYDPVDDITDKTSKIPLENTIRKVLYSKLKLIFPPHFFQDSSLIAPKQIVPIQEKIVSCFSVSGQNNILSSTKDSDEFSLEEESLDDLMKIYFVQKKEPEMSVATVKCKIKCLKILAMILDFGAKPPIITENIIERIGAKINKSEIHDLEGISTVLVESIRVVRNLPITLAPGLIIIEDFIIMRYRKPTLIFSNKLLKKYECAMN
ncbi:hypothetical protein GLOIN_2v1886689 [Rhizophagus clarus]|uniref:Uncharacterized protein n=1 Tax=Rhizophagus clarus TaxID=94130 RepID=A0A8H3LM79_9GLOM|nr:hypothetical protein GLOIN_2v1886689 [Rhizophagus clarus]